MSPTTKHKIYFRLAKDADDYPPFAVETVWARATGTPNEYIMHNVPFFTREATFGDVIVARPDDDGLLWFERVEHVGGHSLVRVVFFDTTGTESVSGTLVSFGCIVETMPSHNLLAASIPPTVPMVEVQDYLAKCAEAGAIDYEEPILRQ